MSRNVIGYAQVRTLGQSLDAQIDALALAQSRSSGSMPPEGRRHARWQDCLEYTRPGNILVVAALTRLGAQHRGPVRYRNALAEALRQFLRLGKGSPLTASARQPDKEGKYRDSAKHRGTITTH